MPKREIINISDRPLNIYLPMAWCSNNGGKNKYSGKFGLNHHDVELTDVVPVMYY
jgi:hypothetical protein